MYSTKSIQFIAILFINLFIQSLGTSMTTGTVSSQYGRIANIADYRIHVSAALSQADCIRQCVDFMKNHDEYTYDDCFAYNYDIDKYTCELIHSIAPLTYVISVQTRWTTGFRY